MPEGPEVTILTEYLNDKLAGDKLEKIEIQSGKYKKATTKNNTIENLDRFKLELPIKIKSIKCRGKFMYWRFSGDWYCFMTLGLTGRVLIKDDIKKYTYQEQHEPSTRLSHIRVKFITDKHEIFYLDMRNFGTINFYNDKKILKDKINKKLGVDLLVHFKDKRDKCVTFVKDKFRKIRNKDKLIADVLLDQKIFAGVGNYVRADALFLSSISPFRKIKDLINDDKEIEKLLLNLYRVMYKSYSVQKKYLEENYYNYRSLAQSHNFVVYQQKKSPDGDKVTNEKMANKRMIWYVPRVQKK